MIDINALDFLDSFNVKEATIGVVGHGYVGQAVEAFFKPVCKRSLIHDKAKQSSSLRDVVEGSEIVFICVPTPMRKDGSCHTGIVEEVLQSIEDVGRNMDEFIVVLKSTVVPGFTKKMRDKHIGMRLLFSPEFLTEANSIQDFEKTNRIILGGEEDDARIAYKFFEGRLGDKIKHDRVLVLNCSSTSAELVKLFTNTILMTKVIFANEMYQVCQKLGVDYEEVRVLSVLDNRIGMSHLKVPGPDGRLGAGGSCFPKDINNLRSVCRELGVPERLFTTVIERNEELRPEKDWEELKGRAVVG